MIVFDQKERVAAWVTAQCGFSGVPPCTAAIGFERNGGLVAGVILDAGSDTNMFAHIASAGVLIPWQLFAAVHTYAFRVSGLDRLTFYVNNDNVKCIRMVESMGAELEFEMKKARPGGSVLGYVLWRDNRLSQILERTGRAERVPHGQVPET